MQEIYWHTKFQAISICTKVSLTNSRTFLLNYWKYNSGISSKLHFVAISVTSGKNKRTEVLFQFHFHLFCLLPPTWIFLVNAAAYIEIMELCVRPDDFCFCLHAFRLHCITSTNVKFLLRGNIILILLACLHHTCSFYSNFVALLQFSNDDEYFRM